MTINLVECPHCEGDGFIWYKGTTGAYGDDPSDWVKCPVCNGKFLVNKEWADGVQPGLNTCTLCNKVTVVAEMQMGGSGSSSYTDLVCHPCCERYHQ